MTKLKEKSKDMDWEKEFDKEFNYLCACGLIHSSGEVYEDRNLEDIKQFIKNLLSSSLKQQREEVIEEINKDMTLYRDGTYHIDFRVWERFLQFLKK